MNKNIINTSAFEHLLDISTQLISEPDINTLLEKILIAAIDISMADAGSIYLIKDKKQLEFHTIINHTLSLHRGGSSCEKIILPPIPLKISGKNNTSAIVAETANTGNIYNIADVYESLPYDFSSARKMDNQTGYRTKSMLSFPLSDHTKNIVGVIQLINSTIDNEIVSFSKEIERQILSFASLATMALSNRALIDDMEKLFESFAKTIASAIDEKSPHTAGHCKRVPELTLMIADAVHNFKQGPMASFSLSPEERHQLSIAGWLHDCGKIATPDHIMDKATKLETIFDRIHYIEAKLEIVERDLQLKHHEKVIQALKKDNNFDTSELDKQLSQSLKQLNNDRIFLKKMNVGGEFLSDEKINHLNTIAELYTIKINDSNQKLLNKNELENLSIQRGTLTNDERKIIQRHMNFTQEILEALPFPKHLGNVTEYAINHHETLDGKGYPRGITKDKMSIPSRIMAVADIFEALSSTDRPYKQAKKVSECLTIMGKFVLKNKIDGDLFTIFVKEKVYEQYIYKFSHPNQIDDFDIDSIPGLQNYEQ